MEAYDDDASSSDDGNPLDRIFVDGGDSLAPFVPTTLTLISHMLRLAGVGPDDVVVDLGCGDGRICVGAAKAVGCRARGVELDAALVAKGQRAATQEGVAHLVHIEQGDIREFDLGDATVVCCFLLPEALAVVEDRLCAFVRAGGRLVCAYWGIQGMAPTAKETHAYEGTGETLLLYTAPTTESA